MEPPHPQSKNNLSGRPSRRARAVHQARKWVKRQAERLTSRRRRAWLEASLYLMLTGVGPVLLLVGVVACGLPTGRDAATGTTDAREATAPPSETEARTVGTSVARDVVASADAREATARPAEARPDEPPAKKPPVKRAAEPVGFDVGALQGRLAGISAGYAGQSGIVVFDPASRRSVAVGADEEFTAASIGKLPTLMALYRAASRGELSLDERITMLPQDVQGYGTGVLHTYPVGYTLTLRECAFLLINESDNTAWEMLERRLGMEYIQDELYENGIRSTDYAWGTTTANDVLMMLQRISDPRFTDQRLSREMLAAMVNTNLEDRIPAALPPGAARVAHKTGSYGDNFGDAGLVYYKDSRGVERHYFVVVLTGDTYESAAREEMREVSRAAYEAIAAPERPRT